MHALVTTPLAAVRARPDVRAEQVSQEALGAVLEVLEGTADWARCRGEDGYEGWLNRGGLRLCEAEQAEAWWDEAGGRPALVLDATLVDERGLVCARLPWGARVALSGSRAVLPDGRGGRLDAGDWVVWDKLGDRFPQDGPAVVATARRWLGTPYLWGGRTRWGADCSGYVQAVYRLHGFLLPRDSHQQAEIGELVEPGSELEGLQLGDLLYFRAHDSARVTHVALAAGGPHILHAAQPRGAVNEDSLHGDSELERSLRARLVRARRLFW